MNSEPMQIPRRRALGALGALALAPVAANAAVAATDANPVPDPGLVARAKAEGAVVLYVAMSAEDADKLVRAFQDRYGIGVQALRLVSNQIPAKLEIEQRGGRFEADLALAPGYETDQMKRAGLIVPFRTPESADYLTGYSDPDGYWTSTFTLTNVIMYNTAKVKALGLPVPAAFADFARAPWRGKFCMFAASYAWYAALKRSIGAAETDALCRAIAANQPALVNTHQLAATLVAAGEYAGSVNVYGHEADRMKAQGQPVDFVNAAPTVAEMTGASIVKNAPHPNAARLFVRWFFSRPGQRWMVRNISRISARKDVQSNPAIWNPRMRVAISDPADSAHYAADVQAFNEIFGIGR